ncbi:hypothetical protein [Streptomyces sp. KR55]|uniref:hypothetical protein n=1 Tax=Streptomyces sp. KR55 TaxID=3457425 RepID=UPI003FD315ED
MDRAAAAYLAARSEAEQNGAIGETAMSQAHLAFVVAFTDPAEADDELELADRLLSRLSLHSTEMTAHVAAFGPAGRRPVTTPAPLPRRHR